MSMTSEEWVAARVAWVAERKREGVEGVFKAQAMALPLPPSFHDAVRVPRAERAVVVGYKRRAGAAGPAYPRDVGEVAAAAEAAGACALAIWPDEDMHGGSYQDILAAAQVTSLPILSRDPVIDPVQIVMARAHGAAAVTLPAAVLGDEELRSLFRQAVELGLDVLVEARSALELDRVIAFRMGSLETSGARLVGVAAVDAVGAADLQLYERLAAGVPEFAAGVATEAVETPELAAAADRAGYDAVLVSDPLLAANDFVEAMRAFAGEPLG